jgi:hypothetical protein
MDSISGPLVPQAVQQGGGSEKARETGVGKIE